MKDNVLFILVWAAYASLRPHIIKEGPCAESVLESRATWGLCYLSLLKKAGKNSRTDLVEVWKTPIGYLQSLAAPCLSQLRSGVSHTSKTLFSGSSADSAEEI